MRTTDDILKDLTKRADDGEDVRQQLISHRALAQFRAERVEAEKAGDHLRVAGLDSQISYHRGLVDEDVDPRIVEQPKKDSVKLAAPADPGDPAAKA